MIRVAFVTSAKIPNLTADDCLCADALRRCGTPVDAVRWDDSTARWTEYDTVVLRSTWDYHLRPAEFRAWVERCERDAVRLWNPGPLVRWNMDKTYLRELSGNGVAIPPCLWIERGRDVNLAAALCEQGWDRAVLKPTISASAYRTYAVSREDTAELQAVLPQVVGDSGAMLQRFIPQIEQPGEWSLVFFHDEFSHAVLKTPRAGDFRVQNELGGRAVKAQPPSSFVAQARNVLATLREPTLYARVDACEVGGQFVLMELELIEPDLFLRTSAEAPDRFADAILARVKRPSQNPMML